MDDRIEDDSDHVLHCTKILNNVLYLSVKKRCTKFSKLYVGLVQAGLNWTTGWWWAGKSEGWTLLHHHWVLCVCVHVCTCVQNFQAYPNTCHSFG